VQKDVPLDPDLQAELDAAADTGAAAAKAALAKLKSVASSTAELLKKAALEADEVEAAATGAMVGRQQGSVQQMGSRNQKGRLSGALRPGADPVQQLQAEVERKEDQLAACRYGGRVQLIVLYILAVFMCRPAEPSLSMHSTICPQFVDWILACSTWPLLFLWVS
jgi:hypothetical protein